VRRASTFAALLLSGLATVRCGRNDDRRPLTVDDRIDRARVVFESKRDFFEKTYPNRWIAVSVDPMGRVTEQVSRPEVSWATAYDEFAPGLPADRAGNFFAGTWPDDSQ
jgi:hypothetical protein